MQIKSLEDIFPFLKQFFKILHQNKTTMIQYLKWQFWILSEQNCLVLLGRCTAATTHVFTAALIWAAAVLVSCHNTSLVEGGGGDIYVLNIIY